MANHAEERNARPARLSTVDALICEAVAEIETAGRSPTRREIAAVVDLDDTTVGAALDDLTRRRILLQARADSGQVYALAEVTRQADREAGR